MTPLPGNCTGINEVILNDAGNITLTMSGGVFLQAALCNNIPTQSAHGTIAATVGTPFELDGQLGLGTVGEIGADLSFGAGSSIDETHTTTISLSAPVPLTSASGASYAGSTIVPEPSSLLLLGSGVLVFIQGLRRKLM